MRCSVVLTTIGPPDLPAVRALVSGCKQRNWGLIVVGDAKSPKSYSIPHGCYLAREDHASLRWNLGRLLPDNRYSLKNLGYLDAVAGGAECVIDIDDDNTPMDNFWHDRSVEVRARPIRNTGWVNIYSPFTDVRVWPRGLPLQFVRTEPEVTLELVRVLSPIQMALADGDPDVDAIYRFVGDLPVHFRKGPPLAAMQSMTPFNSQNTAWFAEAFLLMYLPTFCSFRMTDIWRSFVAMAWLRFTNRTLTIHEPSVFQDRNEHDLTSDFQLENVGYLENERLARGLMDVAEEKYLENSSGIADYLESAYAWLVSAEVIEPREMSLVRAWCRDMGMAMKSGSNFAPR